jgi:hypothetical protein
MLLRGYFFIVSVHNFKKERINASNMIVMRGCDIREEKDTGNFQSTK